MNRTQSGLIRSHVQPSRSALCRYLPKSGFLPPAVIGFIFLVLTVGRGAADNFDRVWPRLAGQIIEKDTILEGRWPEHTINGRWKFRDNVNWFSGFMAGELWQAWHISGKDEFKERALRRSEALIPFAGIDYTHDMGFIFLPSCVEAYRQTGQQRYKQAGLLAAQMLAKRFNTKGQFIRAWGKLGSEKKAGWIIIDTMMNLELLFWAAKESGDQRYYDIAYRHALTSLRESVRPDGSSYHVVEFDPQNGQVIRKRTHQGYSDESTWARGQAWAIYGFANVYRHTKHKPFLATSMRMADFMIARLPADFVPYWDLDLQGEDVLRDASAGAILASGLYLLADQVQLRGQREKYLHVADKIVRSLLANYTFLNSARETEQGLLIHTIYNFNSGAGVDESYPAGDYFFMEALRKYYDRRREKELLKGNRQPRRKILWNKDWYYLQDAAGMFDERSKSGQQWQNIDLPHTWNKWDAVDSEPGYRRSAGWYEKTLFVPDDFKEKRLLLIFEGANISTDVYVNHKKAGRHVGGYLGFRIDISGLLNRGQENLISVRVDNSYNPDIIPSQKSDFFIYGGITRDVWLQVVPWDNLNRCLVSTPHVSREKAEVAAAVTIKSGNPAGLVLKAFIVDPGGMIAAQVNPVKPQPDGHAELRFPVIRQPQLWSPQHPALYKITLRLFRNDQLVDEISETFGLRWFEFREREAFYLNGQRLLLRGTHRHEEHAGFGAAMPNKLHRRDMQMIKEMGANFVRLAHYPQDPEIYHACDELGLLVWDELPWCRGGMGGKTWQENTLRLLQEQITQNFNHPSIIIWSLGNELYWLPDFDDGGNVDSLRAFLKKLNGLAHELDPGRVTAVRKFYEGADIVDLFSPSIWAGWYSGVYKNYQKALEESRKKYKRFFHAEYGGSSHIGRHDENPVSGDGLVNPDGWEEAVNQASVKNIARNGDWSENYIVDLFDWHLHVSEKLDWFTGNAQWAFKDFGTPLRPENAIPYINQKGLLDRAGKPKDAWYVFKSYWTDSPKFCYIESHTWTERVGPPGLARNVCVFSNCSEVELMLNGLSLGRKSKDARLFPASGLNWDVQFSEGNNQLVARGFDAGSLFAADTLNVRYYYSRPGKPDHIELASAPLPNGHLLITATMVDKTGRRCLHYNKRVYFSSDGAGFLMENYGTPGGSSIIEMASGRAAIEFVPVPGQKAVIEVRNQDFKGSYLTIEN